MAPTPEELIELMPFARLVGIEVVSAGPEEVRGRLTLADSLGGLCAYLNLPEGRRTVTLESKTNFIRAVRGGAVEGTARPLHAGRTTILVETRVVDPEGRLVSLTLQTQAVIG
jgi:1,4-dihydroxy-2-naphthoyl-CoA hydrolase